MESLGKPRNHDMVNEQLQSPDGEEQMVRFSRQWGGSSPDVGGNLHPDSLTRSHAVIAFP